MEFLVGVFVLGMLWLMGVILIPIGAVLLMAPRPEKSKAPKPRSSRGPAPKPRLAPAPAPSRGYIPRWDGTRKWQAKEDLANFEQLLNS